MSEMCIGQFYDITIEPYVKLSVYQKCVFIKIVVSYEYYYVLISNFYILIFFQLLIILFAYQLHIYRFRPPKVSVLFKSCLKCLIAISIIINWLHNIHVGLTIQYVITSYIMFTYDSVRVECSVVHVTKCDTTTDHTCTVCSINRS